MAWSTVGDFLANNDARTIDCFHRVQWTKLCQFASNVAGKLGCEAIDRVANGSNNISRQLQFADGHRWVSRIPIPRNTSAAVDSEKLNAEVATMQFIQEKSGLPVPRVFGYEPDESNAVGVAFILMELLPGVNAMTAWASDHGSNRGGIPAKHRNAFYRSVTKCHVQLNSLRLPRIGVVVRSREGGYECGPIPGIGGPFETASAFFEAWAKSVKFQQDKKTIRHMMQKWPHLAERMVAAVECFPSELSAIVSRLSRCENGPFPLSHDDFLHSNILVEQNSSNVTGIIDWEGACTVPIELVAFPDFLEAMPVVFDFPEKYTPDGRPKDASLEERWREREEYIDMVRSFEGEDHLLADLLSSRKVESIAYTYGAYTSTGKLGFYDEVLVDLKKE